MVREAFPRRRGTLAMSQAKYFGVLLSLSFATSAAAHEHHTDKIPEGEAISAEPIVRLSSERKGKDLTQEAGYHAMGTHHYPNRFIRPDIPYRHGPWGVFS